MEANKMNQERLEELATLLRLPCIKREAMSFISSRQQNLSNLECLVELLTMEWEAKRQRRTALRMREASFPYFKTLSSFDFNKAKHIPESQLRELEAGEYINKAEPVIFLGEPGTGKTHLAIALGIAAAEQGLKVRFITVAQLSNLLIEAKDARTLSSTVKRFSKPDVLILDELGYLPLKSSDAELLFQVLSQRQEHKPIIVTSNLPFSEWTSVFPNPRLCKAVIDRITHGAHIIETGTQSVRLSESLEQMNCDKN